MRKLVIIIMACLYGSFHEALAQQTGSVVGITVDNQVQGAVVPDDYVGLSYETAMMKPGTNGRHYFSKDNKPLVDLYRTLGIKSLRLGGSSVDVKGGYTPTNEDIDALFGFARAAGVKVIYSVRLQDKVVGGKPSPADNVADARRQARYINDHYADLLDYFSIGNEPGYYKDYERDLKPRWEAIMRAMQEVAPHARFCAPDDNPNPTLCAKLVKDFHLPLVTLHSYSAGCAYQNPNTAKSHDELIPYDYRERALYLLSDELTAENQRIYSQMARVFGTVPFRLSETNSYWYGGLEGASNSHASMLWALDYMYWWAARGNRGMNFHTGDRVGGDDQIAHYAAFITDGDGFDIFPLCYALKAFGMGAKGAMVPVRLSGESSHLAAYATTDGRGFTYITVINKDCSNGAGARPLLIQLADGGQEVHDAAYVLLTSRNASDDLSAEVKCLPQKGQLLGGQTLMSNGTMAEPLWQQARMEKGRIRVELPPLSAVVIKVCTGNYHIVESEVEPMQYGKYKPTWSSLKKFEVPEWFRDAKFGIWAHWGPQSVPEYGDWYAHYMYKQDSRENKYHVAHYGDPSKVGFKELVHQWTAKNWDPERLVRLYKRAGAQYFVAMANHHDNFDLWDSRHHPRNVTTDGPMRNIMGGWEQAARKEGLRFGVSIHSSRAWNWYDGVTDEVMDSVLYARGHALWHTGYTDKSGHEVAIPDAAYVENYYDRTLDVINKYKPDLVYFDDTVLPLWPESDAGLKIAAHYYNSNALWHGGKQEGVITAKKLSPEQQECLVWDVERGALNELHSTPWQTCTCLGSWHYDRTRFTKNTYKSALRIVRMLADIVSKNGNMLLSVPIRADGTIDEREEAILDSIGDWMQVNRECIFGSRPWHVYGEGPDMENTVEMKDGLGFNEANKSYTSGDIRFTTKGSALYAVVLQAPDDGRFAVASLAGWKADIRKVEILGIGKVPFSCDGEALRIQTNKPLGFVPVIKITFKKEIK